MDGAKCGECQNQSNLEIWGVTYTYIYTNIYSIYMYLRMLYYTG